MFLWNQAWRGDLPLCVCLALRKRSVWLQPVFFRTSDEGHVDHKAHEARVNGIARGDDETGALGEKTVMEQAAPAAARIECGQQRARDDARGAIVGECDGA